MILASLCGSTAMGAMPIEALAGPMSVAPPSTVSLNAPTTEVHYRRWRHRHHWGYARPYRHWGYYRTYRRAYYPRYYGYGYPVYYGYGGYDPAGALFAGTALGLMGAGIAAATAPRWGYGWGGYGWGPGWGWGGWW